ncbi:hypothetical protein V6N13_111001 [Hibiscus sabdariffa]
MPTSSKHVVQEVGGNEMEMSVGLGFIPDKVNESKVYVRGKKSSRLRIMLCYKKSSRFLLNFAAYVGASPSLHHWEVSRLPSDVSLPAWSNKEFMSSCTPLLSPMSSSDVFRAPSPFGPHEEVQRLLSDIQGPDSSRTTCITRWVSHSLWPDITVETGWAVSSEMLSSRCHLESH